MNFKTWRKIFMPGFFITPYKCGVHTALILN